MYLEMSSPAPCTRSWSISEDSLRRYVYFASESCIQELLSASDTTRVGNSSDGWKVLTLDNGVEISKRRSGSLHTFRSRWLLRSVSPEQFITVANAIDAAKQWDSDLVEAKYIKDLEDNLSIIRLRFGESSKPLFRNREFIVYERRETMDDGTLVVAVASLPKEIAAGLHPKQNNAIRALLLQSGWVVEKLEDDSCMVTYVIQLDPAGWLPKCFVNRLNTKLVMIIENLRKQVQACPINEARLLQLTPAVSPQQYSADHGRHSMRFNGGDFSFGYMSDELRLALRPHRFGSDELEELCLPVGAGCLRFVVNNLESIVNIQKITSPVNHFICE
ncbi:hypothetical protein VitviT2T_018896 [Vitis vinifera]|uniref:START domain-containing protein n=1 Tax=Vitis vinifera TaxID=29760 RepID=A0ABY9D0W3_VITVI|nr:hypothetical protein VitviT2T_018896 [Vitis vinifera]